MCGIAGALALGPEAPISEDALVRMRETMVHRGPDGAGVWRSPDCRLGLAHRRLAIIDLSAAAAQPMAAQDGGVVVAFNGEIYNHVELRRELERAGHRFITDHADTEVIIHGYEAWGIDCVHRFRGMFAFALWDAREGVLWLVRDRIGVKPLYYTESGGRLLFGSEIKAILAHGGVRTEPDREALYHYLSFLTTPAPMTLFSGIRKLPGGCRLRAGLDGRVRVERWWDVWDETRDLGEAGDAEIAGRLLDELRTAVRLRKLSDVPVGIFLSGGIDSSTNAALFSADADRAVDTFSVGYDRDYPSYANEFDWAREVAAGLGARHHERRLSVDDVLEVMPALVRHQDEPLADPVCVPVHFVSRLARDAGTIVCQVGEGSDELFAGYPSWHRALRLQRAGELPVPRVLKRAGMLGLRAAGLGATLPYERLRRNLAGQPVFWGGAESLPEAPKRALLAPELRAELDGLSSFDAVRPILERFHAAAPERAGTLDWMSYLDLNLRLPELLLMRVDKMSMAASVECRVPFLDHVFVGLAMSIPEQVKLRGGETKAILKRAVRGVIPDRVIDRPKQGFGVPVYDWLDGALGAAMRAEVRSLAARSGLFDAPAVDAFLDGRPSAEVWTLYNLALWWARNFA